MWAIVLLGAALLLPPAPADIIGPVVARIAGDIPGFGGRAPDLRNSLWVNGNPLTEEVYYLPGGSAAALRWIQEWEKRQPVPPTGLDEAPEPALRQALQAVAGTLSAPLVTRGRQQASYLRLQPRLVDEPGGRNGLPAIAVGGFFATLEDQPRHDRVRVRLTRLGEGFRLHRWLPGAGEDVPGQDVPAIPRYPASRRVVSVALDGDSGRNLTLAYLGGGDVGRHRAHYGRKLEAAGFDETGERSDAAGVASLQYDSDTHRVAVFVSARSDGVLDLIQIQPLERQPQE